MIKRSRALIIAAFPRRPLVAGNVGEAAGERR
jgi:hypothetical protein